MAESSVPTTIGRYDIVRVLGEGAMGVVYEGNDSRLHRKVAIKTILKSALDSDSAKEYSQRFKREAQAVARLNHPNIVQVFDFAEEGDVAYIVMEFVKGRELKQFFQAKQRFELKEVVHIMGELCEALHFAHEAGIVHRDIKPANVMIDEKGRVKLTDFGVARITDLERTVSERTQAGTILGTPAYMSPEQVQGGALDRRSDVFSAGVILYEFLTGERPFPGPGAWTIAKNILQLEPPHPSTLNNEVSAPFDTVVDRALAKKVEDRYQTARELGLALKRALDGLAEAAEAERTVVLPQFAGQVPAPVAPAPQGDATELRTVPNPVAPAAAPARSKEFELEFWRSIKDRSDPGDFEAYLEQFPSGIYSALAKRRAAKLRGMAPEDSAERALESREIEEAARREADAQAKLNEEKAALEARLAKREAELAEREAAAQRKLAEQEAELAALHRREAEAPKRLPVKTVVAALLLVVAGGSLWYSLKPPDPMQVRVAELTRLLEESKRREAELVASKERESQLRAELAQMRQREAEAMKAGDVTRQRELAQQVAQREAEAAKQAEIVRQQQAAAEQRRQELERLRAEAAGRKTVVDTSKAREAEAARQREAEAARVREAEAAKAAEAARAAEAAKAAEATKAAEAAKAAKGADAPKEATKIAAVSPTPAPAPSPAPAPVPGAVTPEENLKRAIALENEGRNADAFKLLRQVARGSGRTAGEAAKRLGDMLQNGKPGVQRDYGEALRYYQIARENGVEVVTAKGR